MNEFSADYRIRSYLKTIPTLMSKISLLHDAVNSGRLEELQAALNEEPEKKKKLVMAKDESGVGLLHKAVYYDLKDIYRWLIDKFPHIINMRDSEGRTAYHYTPMCKDPQIVQRMLIKAGADPSVADVYNRTTKYYMDHKQELELPSSHKSAANSRKSTARDGPSFKKSNIRIWIHQRNLGELQKVVWEGHGGKLLPEHSNNPKVKKFLEAVPHIMGLIKEIHTDVIQNDLESLKLHTAPPIPPVVFVAKDQNGLSPLHKAAGLDKEEMVKYILQENPDAINAVDNEGRTALHYAALLKDDGNMMKLLMDYGADESALDNKQKTAAYYKTRHSEIDSKLLSMIPDCPRSAKESFAASFDWSMLAPGASAVFNGLQNGLKKNEKLSNAIENHLNHMKENGEDNNNDKSESNRESPSKSRSESPKSPVKSNQESPRSKPASRAASRAASKTPTRSGNQSPNAATPPAKSPSPPPSPSKSPHKSRPSSKAENSPKSPSDTPKSPDGSPGRISPPTKSQPGSPAKSRPESKQELKSEARSQNGSPSNGKSSPERQNGSVNNEKSGQGSQNGSPNGKSRSGSKGSNPGRPGSKAEVNGGSPGPIVEEEKVIEGIVNGEDEVENMNNEGHNDKRDGGGSPTETDVKTLVDAGNMEQLAALVLKGEGKKLVGQTSDNPELQSFLDNVPVYMGKIRRIHDAARNGSLRDLQAALDRRKFAIAKDSISPKGASPLHVAVIFGNTSIVRYLAGRFPETVQVTDDDGRTPLHYAAVLKDNGHYYNLLVHLGADMRLEDKFGHTPEYYRRNQEEFNHRGLLKEFGAEDLADEILADKDQTQQENGQVDMPFFATEEGRYLASSLGDPLIKGLTEVANKRPDDPIAYLAQYLYNFAKEPEKTGVKTQENQHERLITGSPTNDDGNKSVPASIDVVTVEPEENDEEDSAFNSTSRDEHGQSMLHFAAARAHGRNALFQLLIETQINIAFRDELYRTARDISIQANLPENTSEIDRYVFYIATKGDTEKLVELLLDGYDHITDIVDDEDQPIIEAVSKANQPETVSFLQSILTFEEKRERVHHAIRQGSINDVTTLLADENDTGSGRLLSIGKNSYGRCTLHIAVLCQQEEIVDYLANSFPDTLKLGDNLERTALHYAMGVEKMETISKVLIKAGAKRVVKDLKGRQPTYYFLNKSDILRLQEEEETF
ncbi:unnamed protein product [Acanthoscelides obtectus]|nr:unnamed protein product [Acanthoscelides obtectus]CAK1622074.1 Putative ankyrin repeat protein PAE1861 [Acanthoscelides obtectus]